VGDAFSWGDDAAIGERVFHMDVFKPVMQCVIGVGVGRLSTLNEIGRIEDGLKMHIVDALEQVGAAGNGIAIDTFLVFMK